MIANTTKGILRIGEENVSIIKKPNLRRGLFPFLILKRPNRRFGGAARKQKKDF
jgi:hypothetical protein